MDELRLSLSVIDQLEGFTVVGTAVDDKNNYAGFVVQKNENGSTIQKIVWVSQDIESNGPGFLHVADHSPVEKFDHSPTPPRVVVTMEDGVVHQIYSDKSCDVRVIHRDIEPDEMPIYLEGFDEPVHVSDSFATAEIHPDLVEAVFKSITPVAATLTGL